METFYTMFGAVLPDAPTAETPTSRTGPLARRALDAALDLVRCGIRASNAVAHIQIRFELTPVEVDALGTSLMAVLAPKRVRRAGVAVGRVWISGRSFRAQHDRWGTLPGVYATQDAAERAVLRADEVGL